MSNKWIVVDVESDGPAPGLFSMVSFGAVVVEPGLKHTFHGLTAPISDKWEPEALAISRISRDEHLAYPDPATEMQRFAYWLEQVKIGFGGDKLVFVTDNLAFDWQFINYYFHRFVGKNPFGYSGRRIGDLWAGFQKNSGESNKWKSMRVTEHTHNPVDDARGNAEALLKMVDLGLRIDDIKKPQLL